MGKISVQKWAKFYGEKCEKRGIFTVHRAHNNIFVFWAGLYVKICSKNHQNLLKKSSKFAQKIIKIDVKKWPKFYGERC